MKLSDLVPSVFTDGDDPEVQITTKKYSQFPKVEGDGVQGVGLKDGQNVRFDLTTDAVAVNPNPFRDAKGRFAPTPQDLENLKNQRDVNEFLYAAIQKVEGGLPSGTIVSDTAPADAEDGVTWYDTVRLELFVYAMGAWLPCSPLGARVEQGEIKQAQIANQVQIGLEEQASLRTKVQNLETTTVTKDYVDDEIGKIVIPEANNFRPILWTYQGSKQAENLLAGEFFLKDMGSGSWNIYMHAQNADNYFWHPADSESNKGQYFHDFAPDSGYGPPITVLNNKGRCQKFLVPWRAYFNCGSTNYVRVQCKWYRSNGNLVNGSQYLLNIPGMLPSFSW